MKVKVEDQVLVPATVVAVAHRDGEEDPHVATVKFADGSQATVDIESLSSPIEEKHGKKTKEKE